MLVFVEFTNLQVMLRYCWRLCFVLLTSVKSAFKLRVNNVVCCV